MHQAHRLRVEGGLFRLTRLIRGARHPADRSGSWRVRAQHTTVAAAILAAVEEGILPPGKATLNAEATAKPARQSARQDARLYGRRDARRYATPIPRNARNSAMSRSISAASTAPRSLPVKIPRQIPSSRRAQWRRAFS